MMHQSYERVVTEQDGKKVILEFPLHGEREEHMRQEVEEILFSILQRQMSES